MLVGEEYKLCCYLRDYYAIDGSLKRKIYDFIGYPFFYGTAENISPDINLMVGQLFYYKVDKGDVKIIDIDIYENLLKHYKQINPHDLNCDNYYKNEIIPKLRDKKLNNLLKCL